MIGITIKVRAGYINRSGQQERTRNRLKRTGETASLEELETITFNTLDDFFKWLIDIGEYDNIDAKKSYSVTEQVIDRMAGK